MAALSWSDIKTRLIHGTLFEIQDQLTPKLIRSLEVKLHLPLTGDIQYVMNNYAVAYLTPNTPPEFQFAAALHSNVVGDLEILLTEEKIDELLHGDLEYLCDEAALFGGYKTIIALLKKLTEASENLDEQSRKCLSKEMRRGMEKILMRATEQGQEQIVFGLLQQGIDIQSAYEGVSRTNNVVLCEKLEEYAEQYNLPPVSRITTLMISLREGKLNMAKHHHSKLENPDSVKNWVMTWAIEGCNINAVKWVKETFGILTLKTLFNISTYHKPNIAFFEYIKQFTSPAFISHCIKNNLRAFYNSLDHDLIEYAAQHVTLDWKEMAEHYSDPSCTIWVLWPSLLDMCARKAQQEGIMVDDLEMNGSLVPETWLQSKHD